VSGSANKGARGRWAIAWSSVGCGVLAGCAATAVAPGSGGVGAPAPVPKEAMAATKPMTSDYVLVNRLTWGATSSAVAAFDSMGWSAYVQRQLQLGSEPLPDDAQRQINDLHALNRPLLELVQDLERQRVQADALTNDDAKKAAQQAYQQALNGLQRDAASRHLLRALYSPRQVQEEMTWFWLNHFSVHQGKGNLRALVGDYEETALRPHAMGHFRDLLGAVVTHPAMLRYLDNEQNALGHLNENYARELMELHTLGVDGGYSQTDVQELARVLTGVGINQTSNVPGMKPELRGFYVRRGLFEFNPARHDFGSKTLLGKPVHGSGLAELDDVLDRLASQPATARFISGKLAHYWLGDTVPGALVQRMAATFEKTRGDIAAVLAVLFASPEFVNGAPHTFKDPMRYVVSAVRLAYDQKVVLNVGPMLNWLNRMGEPLYGRLTPDGYPMQASAWASPGQMATRFEVAKAIGSGSAGLFKVDGPQPQERAAFPQLSNAVYYQSMARTLAPATLHALDQAVSPQEWNSFLLSAPEMMVR